MNRIAILLTLALVLPCHAAKTPDQSAPSETATAQETIILLHGMGRSRLSMWYLGRRFRKAGYKTANFPYTQAFSKFAENSARLPEFISKETRGGRYHLVGHSLGNILLRDAFRRPYPKGLGRVVMLAPPNKPAVYAQRIQNMRVYKWLFGDSGQKLADAAFYKKLPIPSVEFAVIAGTKGIMELKGPNDGLVQVKNTKLKGMKAFREIHATHTFIMNKKEAFRLTEAFLRTGEFPE
jgi:triacylglycerol lipase